MKPTGLQPTGVPSHKVKAAFVEPMLLLRTRALPHGANWTCELKLDGYRGLAIKVRSGAVNRLRECT